LQANDWDAPSDASHVGTASQAAQPGEAPPAPSTALVRTSLSFMTGQAWEAVPTWAQTVNPKANGI